MNRSAFTIVFLALTTATAFAIPKIAFDPTNADLGILEGDVEAPFIVFIVNEGDSPLHIARVKTTCGCTAVALPDSTLDPGERVPLKGMFNSRKLSGEIHKAIFIESDDPETVMPPMAAHKDPFSERGDLR